MQTKDNTYKYRLKGMYQVLLSFVRKHRDTQHRTPHQPNEYCRLASKWCKWKSWKRQVIQTYAFGVWCKSWQQSKTNVVEEFSNHYLSHNQRKGSDTAYGFFMHEYASMFHTPPDVPHKKGPKVKWLRQILGKTKLKVSILHNF